MWVLEARKDADVVWYSIIWEEVKDASNVIDYNINEEITTDTSAVFNANNDTTTGMATVIPWVNAPKLKLSTSIYVDKLEIPSVYQTLYGVWDITRPDEPTTAIRSMTSQSSYWNMEFTYFSSPSWILYSWMKAPVEWTYSLYARYKYSSSTFWYTYEWRTPNWWWSSDTVWHTYTTAWNNQYEYETITRYFNKWEVFFIVVTMNRSSSTPLWVSPDILIEVQKIA